MPPQNNDFSNLLIDWYQINRRELPWRETNDPYKIWLSEIILQQTRVDQGLPYYLKFIDRFETVHQLASATQDEVLRLWQGLGYYSRARNLHQCAKIVSEEMGGQFPTTYNELLKLKGIGSYTAAAIASIAFGVRVPVIDGNVFRVLSRVFGIENNIAESRNRKIFFETATELMPEKNPELFNQAVMEFGALHCTPKKPSCEDCPLATMCYAFEHQKQGQLPVNNKKIYLRRRNFNYLVFILDDSLLFKKRLKGDIWEGLYDFYLDEEDSFSSESDLMKRISASFNINLEIDSLSHTYDHILTHQRIKARFFRIVVNDRNFATELKERPNFQLMKPDQIDKIPKPRLIESYLADEKKYLTS